MFAGDLTKQGLILAVFCAVSDKKELAVVENKEGKIQIYPMEQLVVLTYPKLEEVCAEEAKNIDASNISLPSYLVKESERLLRRIRLEELVWVAPGAAAATASRLVKAGLANWKEVPTQLKKKTYGKYIHIEKE